MYFNIFSKNPKSPWATRGRFRMRIGTLYLAVLTSAIVGVSFYVHDSVQFLYGSTVTQAQFSAIVDQSTIHGIKGSKISYTGNYTYDVNGQQYNVISHGYAYYQAGINFAPTARVVYKDDSPATSKILAYESPQAEFLWVISGILGFSVFLYFVCYGIGWIDRKSV